MGFNWSNKVENIENQYMRKKLLLKDISVIFYLVILVTNSTFHHTII